MSGLIHITDPSATTGFFNTTAKQGFTSVSGSRHGTGTLTEAAFRTVVQSIYEAGGKAQNYRLFCGSSIMNAYNWIQSSNQYCRRKSGKL